MTEKERERERERERGREREVGEYLVNVHVQAQFSTRLIRPEERPRALNTSAMQLERERSAKKTRKRKRCGIPRDDHSVVNAALPRPGIKGRRSSKMDQRHVTKEGEGSGKSGSPLRGVEKKKQKKIKRNASRVASRQLMDFDIISSTATARIRSLAGKSN